MNPNEEKILRESIRQIIRHVKDKRSDDENKLRDIIKEFIEFETILNETETPDLDPAPNKSTGINVLEQLLKKIVPILEDDYKSLTTSNDQRDSFRAHILNAVINTLTPARINNQAGESEESGDLGEEITINVGDDEDDKFIDIRTDAEKRADDEASEDDPKDKFGSGVEGDETGRNVAYQSFKKIETNIIDSYEVLASPEDQDLYFDYLLANLKLYFDKFEEEIATSSEEPTNKAYDMAKSSEQPEETGSDDLELDL